MHTKSSATQPSGDPSTELQLERLPNGEYAWLRPAPARYVLTDQEPAVANQPIDHANARRHLARGHAVFIGEQQQGNA